MLRGVQIVVGIVVVVDLLLDVMRIVDTRVRISIAGALRDSRLNNLRNNKTTSSTVYAFRWIIRLYDVV